MGQLDLTGTAPHVVVGEEPAGPDGGDGGALVADVLPRRRLDVAVQVKCDSKVRNQDITFQVQGLKPGAFKLWVNWIRELVQPRLDRCHRHGVDAREQLGARDAAPVRQQLAADLLGGGGGGALAVQQQRGLQRLLGAREVVQLRVVDEVLELRHDAERDVDEGLRQCSHIYFALTWGGLSGN
jgi:hypothetical protein